MKLKELEEKTNDIIAEQSKGHHVIVVGHLVPEINIRHDVTVVLRIRLKELVSRLEERGYVKEKIRENVISEAVDYCGLKALETCKETYEIESDSDKVDMISYIVGTASGSKRTAPEYKEISRLEELLELVAEGNKYGF